MTDQLRHEHAQGQPEKKRQRRPKGRANGEGSVFKRSGTNRSKPWVAQITRENGKKETIGYFKTESEALAARNKALRELQQGQLVDKSRQTLKEYLNYWLEHVHKSTIEITTYAQYRHALDLHLIPGLGHIPLQKLSMSQVQMFYSQLVNEKSLGPGRVGFLHTLLRSALEHAVTESLLAKNVCVGVKLPRLKKREQCVLTPAQAEHLLLSIQSDAMRMLILLAIVTGIRRGELLGLKWQDIDFKKRKMRIRRELVYVPKIGLIEKNPKSEHSKREISLPLFVADALEKHQANQQQARIEAGENWLEHDLVFCRNGGHIYPATLDRQFKRLLQAADLSLAMRLHDLRHSAVTILLQMGVPPHVVQEIAGHSNVNITLNVYGHVLPGQQESAMDKWDGVLGGGNQERLAAMRQQWTQYSAEIQALLEDLLKQYGEGAVQMAMNLISLLK